MKKALLSLLLFATACSSNSDNKADDIIVADSMVSIMVDIHIAEASMPAMQIYGEKMNEVALAHYEHIYKLHHVTAEEFKKSYEYYVNQPDEYKGIYEKVLNRLDKMKP